MLIPVDRTGTDLDEAPFEIALRVDQGIGPHRQRLVQQAFLLAGRQFGIATDLALKPAGAGPGLFDRLILQQDRVAQDRPAVRNANIGSELADAGQGLDAVDRVAGQPIDRPADVPGAARREDSDHHDQRRQDAEDEIQVKPDRSNHGRGPRTGR
jgi:hypothetical protein